MWILSFKLLSVQSPPGNHSKSAFLKYSKNVNEGDESYSKIEFRMLSKQIYYSKLSTNCFPTDGYVNNVTYCNFPHIRSP